MIFSLGHSTHSPEQFVELARGVDVIVDVRSHPTSRWEWWRLEQMRDWLPAADFEVVWLPGLGGWTQRHYADWHEPMAAVGVDLASYSRGAFPKQRIGVDRAQVESDGDKPSWTNQGLYDYAWYTATPEFQTSLAGLIDQYAGRDQPNAALVCAEALWWKCHRSMVADALVFCGHDCLHLPPAIPKRETTPRWKRHRDALTNRLLRYPAPVLDAWAVALDKNAPV